MIATESPSPARRPAFITWYPYCRRSDTIAAAVGGRSHLIHFLKFKRPLYAAPKYVMQAVRTWMLLKRDQPDLVFVASPPVFAVLAVWLYAALARVPFVIDAHSGTFDHDRWRWLLPLTRFLSRRALATVVTNRHHEEVVSRWGATARIIADVPVEFPAAPPADLGAGFHVVVINTFSHDEPLGNVIEAARRTPDVRLHVTGDLRYLGAYAEEALPANLSFTGWLSERDYAALLRAADAVMVLTTSDNTMQRGAYEAVAVEKPLITSDWPLLEETFHAGTLHVRNSAADIARALEQVRRDADRLRSEMRTLRIERRVTFDRHLDRLLELLGDHALPAAHVSATSS